MRGPTPPRLRSFACRCLGLGGYLKFPGDGRLRPQIPARHLLWALLICAVLREPAFHAIEALVRSRARRGLGVGCPFGDDSLAYFTERLDPAGTRAALAGALRRAKRNKAFAESRYLGLALDGTGACRSEKAACAWCHPVRNAEREITAHLHHFCLASLVGARLVLPLDVEPYGPGDSELAASLRLLERVGGALGARFADYVVADGLYAAAPFLHAAGRLHLRVVVRLKGNLPELYAGAQTRFGSCPPTAILELGDDRVEIWDAADFDPWTGLAWPTMRVLRYRQHKPNGEVVEAYWLTDWSPQQVSSAVLYAMAKWSCPGFVDTSCSEEQGGQDAEDTPVVPCRVSRPDGRADSVWAHPRGARA